jgi:hypothetical protein
VVLCVFEMSEFAGGEADAPMLLQVFCVFSFCDLLGYGENERKVEWE